MEKYNRLAQAIGTTLLLVAAPAAADNTVEGWVRTPGLYGTGNTVQCSSCHTTHDPTNGSFLRKANTNSALCTTCHP